MIALYAGKALAFLKNVPWQLYAAAAILIVAWAWGNHRYGEGVDDTEAKYAEIARQAAEKARKADSAARGAVDASRGRVAAENDAARKAAEGSDDPLRAGLDSLNKN